MECVVHPQPSSVREALEAARKAGFAGKVVLDPFCGTGTLVLAAHKAGAARVIGCDIEDWSASLRPELARLLRTRLFDGNIELHWRVDALEAVERFDHDVLFTDPPDPHDILGGRLVSMLVTGAELRRLLRERLDSRNMMGKKYETIRYVVTLVKRELKAGRLVVINAYRKHWARGCFFDWKKMLARWFRVKELYGSYVILDRR